MTRSRARRWFASPLALAPLLLAAAACTAEPATSPAAAETASPFADCAALVVAPSTGSSAAPSPRTSALPDVEIPCFTGGAPVKLAAVRGPAVINLWASWCEPCRTELPVIQSLADRSQGRVHVLGVDTGDSRDAAASFGAAKGVSMPTLFDRDRTLLAALGRINLPITIFVDPGGRQFVHPMPVDPESLSALLREHTGVAVAP